VCVYVRVGWGKCNSPNCETETANRTLQTGSLTVPADGYTIIFHVADFFVKPGILIVRKAMKDFMKHLHKEHSDTNNGFIYRLIISFY
jgi:hypothetical protein